jgi:hypothetical protein
MRSLVIEANKHLAVTKSPSTRKVEKLWAATRHSSVIEVKKHLAIAKYFFSNISWGYHELFGNRG